MKELNVEQKMYYSLRVAMAMCFIGHGTFGIITKQIWCNYFAVMGIGTAEAYRLMPVVGAIDILMGIVVLVYPLRAIAWWLVGWGLFTALLRPLSGEPFAEFVERAGNYGAPLALLLLCGVSRGGLRGLFSPLSADIVPDSRTLQRVRLCLRLVVFLLLAGHGWLNLIEKKGLLQQYASLGLAAPARVAVTVGILEVIAAFAVLIRPMASLLLVLFVWKMCSELLYPQYELFEWIERGGSYGSILALYFLTRAQRYRHDPGLLRTGALLRS